MLMRTGIVGCLAAAAATCSLAAGVPTDDELRNVKKGEPLPTYALPALEGEEITSQEQLGKVVVIVCLSAGQRRSELAAVDSFHVVQELADERVRLLHMTANAIEKDYFRSFRQEQGIDAPLLFDADRAFYGKLPLIVLPTTIIVDAKGNLAHVISLHSSRYEATLEAYIFHALGELTDDELSHHLETGGRDPGSPKSRASAHRALAHSMREKGQLITARSELLKAREQDPDDNEIVLDLADLDLVLGDLDSTADLVDLVLARQNNNRRALQLKGIVLFHRGDLSQAETMLTEALKLNPNPERVHYYLGQICEKKGDAAGALEHYREALRGLLDE